MEKIIASALAVLGLAFIMPILGTLIGAFMGLIVGLFFGQTILDFLAAVGVNTVGMTMWQVGAAMGFLGSFLRTTVSKT